MDGFIKVKDFIKHLEHNNLVIVSRNDLMNATKIDLDLLRRDLLNKKDLSIKDIIDGKFLPIRTKSGVRNWITDGRFKENEVYKNSAGQIRILTSAIKRLGYANE